MGACFHSGGGDKGVVQPPPAALGTYLDGGQSVPDSKLVIFFFFMILLKQ